MKILIRTSGGRAPKKELGMGHIFRVLNLAGKLRKNKISFLIEDYGGIKHHFEKNNFKNIFIMKNNQSLDYDIKKTKKIIDKINPDLIIVDKYKTKISYLKEMKKFGKVIYISDLDYIDVPADLVICGFIGFNNKKILNKYSTKCILGPKYQILNKKFSEPSTNKKNVDLLATFGGFDENNLAEILLEELINQKIRIKTKIILGPSTKKSKKLQSMEKETKEFVKIVCETNNMANEISQAEYGLCSGGLTTYEFACKQVPFGIISQVKHQLKTAKIWERKKIGKNLGLANKNTPKKIREFLKIVVNKEDIFTKSKIVDGLGTQRISKEIQNIYKNF